MLVVGPVATAVPGVEEDEAGLAGDVGVDLVLLFAAVELFEFAGVEVLAGGVGVVDSVGGLVVVAAGGTAAAGGVEVVSVVGDVESELGMLPPSDV